MKNAQAIILSFSFIATSILLLLSYFGQKREGEKTSQHLLVLLASLLLQSAIYALVIFQERFLPLAMLGWVLPLYAITQVLQSLEKAARPWERWHYTLLVAGAIGSGIMAGVGNPFLLVALPFAILFTIVGLHLTFSLIRVRRIRTERSAIQKTFIVFSAFYFLSSLGFPIFAMAQGYLFFDVMVSLGLGVSAWASVMELWKNSFVDDSLQMEKARTDKLVGNSKYSELGMMAAGIAHEINNPLAVIQARTTQLLRIYREPKRQQELADGLQQILFTSERINRTIQGVREFVHDERSGTAEIRLKDLIDDVLAFCGQRMKNHGVNLRFYNIDNYNVWGNKIQLEQILLNLLNNSFDAIEFLPDKWIEVTASQNDDRIQIYVKDSGHGIPAEVAAHIMEPFYSTKDVGKGTGLGLALARGIAEKHGGNLSYVPAAHTTFMLELPRQPREDWGLPLH